MRGARNRVTLLAALAATAVGAVLAAGCGREDPDLSTGKQLFVEKCGTCHALNRAGTQATVGPNLDEAFEAALRDGMDRDTVQGIVRDQIANVIRGSKMPADLVKGDDARDVAAYVAFAAGKSGEDGGALAQAGLAGATTGEQIYTAAGCGSCHTFRPAGSSGTTGPNLDELRSAAAQREPGKSAEEYTRESILQPDAFLVEGFGNAMPAFEGRLDDRQVQALVDYLLGR